MAEEDDSRRGSWYQQVTGLVTPQEKTPTETFFACQCLSIKQRFIAISICGGGGLLVLVLVRLEFYSPLPLAISSLLLTAAYTSS
jgi:hypothetical protein